MFKLRLDDLNNDKKELQEKIKSLTEIIDYEKGQLNRISNLAPVIQNVLDVYHLSSAEQKNRLLKSVIRDIIVFKPKKYNEELHLEIFIKE